MSIHEALAKVLSALPEERLYEVLHFAEFLSLKQEQQHWQQSGMAHFAKCYGADEPDYGEISTPRRLQSE
jgi:hypothetical protein